MITFTVSAFVIFLTIIDPVGLAPVIIGLTAYLNDIQRTILYVNLATVSGNPLSLLAVGAAIISSVRYSLPGSLCAVANGLSIS
ncbi:MAG: hypothetical protein M3Y76_03755 [Chloroflexota bacterium]|nr:hypothetical protein [Chloroflexota bacterium]